MTDAVEAFGGLLLVFESLGVCATRVCVQSRMNRKMFRFIFRGDFDFRLLTLEPLLYRKVTGRVRCLGVHWCRKLYIFYMNPLFSSKLFQVSFSSGLSSIGYLPGR